MYNYEINNRIDPYLNLANAIIVQAAEDYKDVKMRPGCRSFFRSQWFMLLSRGSVDGETIIKHLENKEEAQWPVNFGNG